MIFLLDYDFFLIGVLYGVIMDNSIAEFPKGGGAVPYM
jgi:hypothetical protein